MSYDKSNIDRLLKAIKFNEADRIPHLEHWVNKKTIEYVLGKEVGDPVDPYDQEKVIENPLNPHDLVEYAKKIGQDAINYDFVWGFGFVYKVASNGTTHYVDGIYKDWEDIKALKLPSIDGVLEQFGQYYEAVKGTGIGLYPIIRSVFDTTYLAIGLKDFMYKIYDDIKLIEYLMDFAMEHYYSISVEVIKRFPDIPFVLIADDLAGANGLMINPEKFKKLYIPRLKKILEPIHKRNIPVVFHCDGNMVNVIPILIDCGAVGAHPIQPSCNDIYKLKKQYFGDFALFGNIDTVLLANGTKEEIKEDVKNHCNNLKDGGGYILGSSSSIFDGIPPENFITMVNAVHEYGRY
ncbi:MAG: uroporphyrinogen decarboxylase family protein [Candidatus Humimicrobiaceae bacterium]